MHGFLVNVPLIISYHSLTSFFSTDCKVLYSGRMPIAVSTPVFPRTDSKLLLRTLDVLRYCILLWMFAYSDKPHIKN